jgi:hypothetical protein
MHRVIAVALVVLALALGLVVVRTWYASRDEWQAAETLVAQYNRLPRVTAASREEGRDRRAELLRDAIIRYREAALWYLPANPYVRRSIERLLLIGQRAEQAADDRLALYAYRAARSAVLGTRTFFVNDEEGRGCRRASSGPRRRGRRRCPVRSASGGSWRCSRRSRVPIRGSRCSRPRACCSGSAAWSASRCGGWTSTAGCSRSRPCGRRA